MKSRDVVVTMVIPDCTLPMRTLRGRYWSVKYPTDTEDEGDWYWRYVTLTERPRVDPQTRKRRAKK